MMHMQSPQRTIRKRRSFGPIYIDGVRPIGLTDEDEAILRELRARGRDSSFRQSPKSLRASTAEKALDEASCRSEADVCSVCEECEEEDEDCPVCFDSLSTSDKSWPAKCGHRFCASCTTSCLKQSPRCPLCRAAAPGRMSARDMRTLRTVLAAKAAVSYVEAAVGQRERARRWTAVRRAYGSQFAARALPTPDLSLFESIDVAASDYCDGLFD